jgi:hypothetical protein
MNSSIKLQHLVTAELLVASIRAAHMIYILNNTTLQRSKHTSATHSAMDRAIPTRTATVYAEFHHNGASCPNHCTVNKNVARSRKFAVGVLIRVFGEFLRVY